MARPVVWKGQGNVKSSYIMSQIYSRVKKLQFHTAQMWADFFTHPLVGNKFGKDNKKIMKHIHPVRQRECVELQMYFTRFKYEYVSTNKSRSQWKLYIPKKSKKRLAYFLKSYLGNRLMHEFKTQQQISYFILYIYIYIYILYIYIYIYDLL